MSSNKKNNFVFRLVIVCTVMLAEMTAWGEVLDGVAAVVDDQIILLSEVNSQLQMALMQAKISPSDSARVDSLRKAVLDQMVDDKLILIEAKKDTSIKVTNEDVQKALDNHIAKIKEQFSSEQAFQAQLSAEGLTLKELRNRYKDEVKNQLYKEKLLQKRLGKITISSGEVKEFYRTHIDSLPKMPAGVHLAHILIAAKPGPATLDSLRGRAELLLSKAKSGEDFAMLARTYSDDEATAAKGGDLGWFGHGDMVPDFEKAAFALETGDISGLVKTQFGFHIIKCAGHKEGKIRASHILIKTAPTEKDLAKSKAKADSLYNLLKAGANFDSLAVKYSDDESTAKSGGDLGWYASSELFDEFKDIVEKLKPGEFSKPVLSRFGYHIIKVLEKKKSRPLDFKKDYDDIEAIAKRYKSQAELEKWLKQVRQEHYIEIKM